MNVYHVFSFQIMKLHEVDREGRLEHVACKRPARHPAGGQRAGQDGEDMAMLSMQ